MSFCQKKIVNRIVSWVNHYIPTQMYYLQTFSSLSKWPYCDNGSCRDVIAIFIIQHYGAMKHTPFKSHVMCFIECMSVQAMLNNLTWVWFPCWYRESSRGHPRPPHTFPPQGISAYFSCQSPSDWQDPCNVRTLYWREMGHI